MPLDVIMPALGMAQESGVIVAWHKKPGDQVAEGDVLFEVETDKATMEVEAQGAGFLAGVSAGEGDEVAVGKVIARISDTAEGTDDAPKRQDPAAETDPAPADDPLPEGQDVIMPTLGMAQDSGVLVGWLVEPGGRVSADEPLFEVETDKSTMEVPAGVDGYLAAQLARPGDEVPTGQTIAIVSAEAVDAPVVRGGSEAPARAPAAETAGTDEPDPKKAEAPAPRKTEAEPPARDPGGRILASPKARRLARERGLDLARLVRAGHPEPYHVKDLEVLATLPDDAAPVAGQSSQAGGPVRHLTAEGIGDGFTEFAEWAAEAADLRDPALLLAGLAGACLDTAPAVVAVEAFGRRRLFDVPNGPLGGVAEIEEGRPDLVLRDLRGTRVSGLSLGPEGAPTLSLTASGGGLSLTLECTPDQLSAAAAVSLISEFAGRLEQPLRHLL